MLWSLRYKKPQGVATVLIETETNMEADALALGRWFVNQQPGPAYRFISVERAVVARSKDMAPEPRAETPPQPNAVPPAGLATQTAETGVQLPSAIQAPIHLDDEMSGPRVAPDQLQPAPGRGKRVGA